MEYIRVIFMKFLLIELISIVLVSVLGPLSIYTGIIVGIFLTAANYIIGDLLVLPNISASADILTQALVTGLSLWVMRVLIVGFEVSTIMIIIVSISIAGSDWLLHRYIDNEEVEGRGDWPD
ncbi:DUF2512 family protein [Selenihalanaerobacter shriftii]|uniref:4 TMS phage holin, superfamily IV n=1 Tax=Selenihalanaerobacter shriftii TaxID=142842 RepID=A0A1T4JKQ1_9FIRM|nr:DUF2512 family protein [Selenihalanaerobacter shriftii]SJZ30790.1 Protein of unknown function [Selenihalanaerobacter shriftii]